MEYKFTFAIDDEKHLISFLEKYNCQNSTDFEIDEILYDEVVFARLRTIKKSNNEILDLGIQYGKELVKNRILK